MIANFADGEPRRILFSNVRVQLGDDHFLDYGTVTREV